MGNMFNNEGGKYMVDNELKKEVRESNEIYQGCLICGGKTKIERFKNKMICRDCIDCVRGIND